MIELRWAEIERDVGEQCVFIEKVLQYRTGKHSAYVGEPDIIWSEWMDVPTVSP